MIEVVATREGYSGKVRKEGDKFTVPNKEAVSKRWMLERGTPEYDAFMVDSLAQTGNDDARIANERIASGGINEQLAIATTTIQQLTAKVAELEAENAVLKDQVTAPVVEPAAVDAAPTGENESENATVTTAKTRRRRSSQN
jgi:hypothetical protein